MSLLGKILAVLNVLAALAFGYLAALDYGKRQVWSNAVLRHRLALEGLPLTEAEKDLEGNVRVRDIDKGTEQDLSRQAGGRSVTNQKAEVEHVKGELQGKIDGSNPVTVANPFNLQEKLELKAKRQKLAWALRPFTDVAGRREALNRLMAAGDDDPLDDLENFAGDVFVRVEGVFDPAFEAELKKLNAAQRQDAVLDRLRKLDPAARREAIAKQLQADLSRVFTDATPLPAPEKGNPKGEPEEMRRRVAWLLLGRAELAADEETAPGQPRNVAGTQAYRRALAVVGLEAALNDVNARAAALFKMSEAIRAAMGRDRSLFAQQHRALVVDILAAADDLFERRIEIGRERAKVAKQLEVLNDRRAEHKQLTEELAKRQKETAARLAEQSTVEQQLFQLQQEFRDATAENERMEREIRELEKGR